MKNQSINCCVDNCKHHEDSHCMLESITVGECKCHANCKDDTVCSCFEM